VALFAAHDHLSTPEQRVEAENWLQACLSGKSYLCDAVTAEDADLRIYELDLAHPTAPDEASIINAMAYGMMAVEPGVDCLIAGGFGGGSEDAAARTVAVSAIASLDCAAIAGAIIAARLAGIPVILDGLTARTSLKTLETINPAIAEHCILPDAPGREPGTAGLNRLRTLRSAA
jgi:nicotinate-nucleotide--dimethylbenzimidazole phosphoribosyltransferase